MYLYPDRMEITSYPGPVAGIEMEHLNGISSVPPVPARNRRIGEFLKELKLAEGRGTGLPKVKRAMTQNGSPPPRFDFDGQRTYFRVVLSAHPEYKAILALQDISKLKAIGDASGAVERLKTAFAATPGSLSLATELVREYLAKDDLPAAIDVYETLIKVGQTAQPSSIISLIASALLDKDKEKDAMIWLDRLKIIEAVDEAVDAAYLKSGPDGSRMRIATSVKRGPRLWETPRPCTSSRR